MIASSSNDRARQMTLSKETILTNYRIKKVPFSAADTHAIEFQFLLDQYSRAGSMPGQLFLIYHVKKRRFSNGTEDLVETLKSCLSDEHLAMCVAASLAAS